MAGKVLTEDDFAKGGDPTKEDTSPKEELIPADQKFDQDGKVIKEEPDKEEPPKEEVEDKDKVEPLPKSSDEKKYKYDSMDEYDKAYKEAERKMHEATTRASMYEKELSQYKKPPEKPVTIDDKIREMTKKTLKEISIIPSDAPNRDEDAGFLWAKLQSDISDLKYEERTRHTETERQIVTRTYERAQKEGLKTDAELRILGYEFSKTDPSLNTDDRIERAVENTKQVLSQIREGFVRSQQRDKKEKDDLKVLGRGSTRVDDKESKPNKPVTMAQQLAELHEKRKMTRDDLR